MIELGTGPRKSYTIGFRLKDKARLYMWKEKKSLGQFSRAEKLEGGWERKLCDWKGLCLSKWPLGDQSMDVDRKKEAKQVTQFWREPYFLHTVLSVGIT